MAGQIVGFTHPVVGASWCVQHGLVAYLGAGPGSLVQQLVPVTAADAVARQDRPLVCMDCRRGLDRPLGVLADGALVAVEIGS